MNPPLLRSPKRVHIDTAGKWRGLVVPTRWGFGKAITELAERWTTTPLLEVDALLATQPKTQGFVAGEGLVGLHDIDLLLEGEAPGGRTLLGVLPIADEPLGPTVGEALEASLHGDRLRGGKSPVEGQAQAVFNIEASVIAELRYRILSVNAKLLAEAEARGCTQAVLVIHEFRSPLTLRQIVADQIAAVEQYVRKHSHRGATATAGVLVGPLYSRVPLYIGRVVVER